MRPEGTQVREARQRARTPVGRQVTPIFPSAMPVQPEQRAFRRDELLAALNLPVNARLQFGGREWLQDFDESARLIVTVPK